jgi:iron complex transport system substrate-binding protein
LRVATTALPELSTESLGKNRIIADAAEIVRRNPDIMSSAPGAARNSGAENVAARPGWQAVNAVRHGQLFEIKSPDILQPGPAGI